MNRRATQWLSGGCAALLVLGALFGRPEHPHFWWEEIPGFAAVLGLAGAVALGWLAKGVLRPLIERPEDYYDH